MPDRDVWLGGVLSLGFVLASISGCGPEGVGTITLPKDARESDLKATGDAAKSKKSSRRVVDETKLPKQEALPKAVKKKG